MNKCIIKLNKLKEDIESIYENKNIDLNCRETISNIIDYYPKDN